MRTLICSSLMMCIIFVRGIASGESPEKCHEFCESMKKIAWNSYVAATKGSKPTKIKQQAIRNNHKVDKDIVALSVDKGLEMFYMSGNELLKNRSQSIAAIKTGCYLGCTNPGAFAGLLNPYSNEESVSASKDDNYQPQHSEEHHKGRVLSTTEDINGYFYSKIEENGEVYWVVCKEAKTKVGDLIGFTSSSPLINFESKTLNTVFDKIFFTEKINVY